MPAIRRWYARNSKSMTWFNLLTKLAQVLVVEILIGAFRIAGTARSYERFSKLGSIEAA